MTGSTVISLRGTDHETPGNDAIGCVARPAWNDAPVSWGDVWVSSDEVMPPITEGGPHPPWMFTGVIPSDEKAFHDETQRLQHTKSGRTRTVDFTYKSTRPLSRFELQGRQIVWRSSSPMGSGSPLTSRPPAVSTGPSLRSSPSEFEQPPLSDVPLKRIPACCGGHYLSFLCVAARAPVAACSSGVIARLANSPAPRT